MKIPVPDYIESIRPYMPGKPVQEVERELGIKNALKLASNESPLGPSPRAMEAVREYVDQLHVYPEGGGYYLCQALSRKYGVPAKNIILGNGSMEIIEIASRTFLSPDTRSVFSAGSFALYPITCRIVNAKVTAVPMVERNHDLDALLRAIDDKTRLVLIDNPINPTGRYVPLREVEAFMEKVPETALVVLDEAYKEFVRKEDYGSALSLMDRFPNLMVLGTFSKAYGLAGLRIGYGFGHPDVIGIMHKARSPFNTNAVAQIAATAALDDDAFVKRYVELNEKEVAFLNEGCRKMGLEVTPSVANFIFMDVPMDGVEFFQKLMREGVIVRPMKGNGYPNSLRVNTHFREGDERFLAATAKVLGR